MEGELEAASAKYVRVQDLKAYVADLCSMLQASARRWCGAPCARGPRQTRPLGPAGALHSGTCLAMMGKSAGELALLQTAWCFVAAAPVSGVPAAGAWGWQQRPRDPCVQRAKQLAPACNQANNSLWALQDKSVLVEELEDALLGLCEGRASAWEARRTAADTEEHAPAEAAVAAAAAVLSRGGGGAADAAASAAAAAAAAAEERLLGRDLPVELDEFGRDANAEKRAELAERWERAQRGMAQRGAWKHRDAWAARRVQAFTWLLVGARCHAACAAACVAPDTIRRARPPPAHCSAKRRQARLAALEEQWERQRGQAGGAAEPHLGDATTEESEGEVSHFRMRQAEVQEAADAGVRAVGAAGRPACPPGLIMLLAPHF